MLPQLPSGGQVGVVSFARDRAVLTAPTDDRTLVDDALDVAHDQRRHRSRRRDRRVARARRRPGDERDGKPSTAIVLLTDGSSTEGKVGPLAAAKQAKDAGVPVYTVSLGTDAGVVRPGTGQTIPVPPDPARSRGSRRRRAAHLPGSNAAQLSEVYEGIGTASASRCASRIRALRSSAAGGLLALLASAGSLGWFRELA